MKSVYPCLRDQPVLITGGASGIGAAIVEAFAGQGAKVAFVDVDAEAGAALQERLVDSGSASTVFLKADLTDVEELRSAVSEAAEKIGPIRTLVNNAGWDQRHPVEGTTPELWDQLQNVNLRPHFFTAQAVTAGMRAAGGGSIINLSSNCWLLAVGGYPGYAAAKAGIVGLTRGLARDLGPDNIRVNALLPGWVMTERQLEQWLTPEAEVELLEQQCLKRKLVPMDIARMVVFLASSESAMMTGQSVILDGGRA